MRFGAHHRWLAAGLIFALIAAAVLAVYLWLPKASLVVTTGPAGTPAAHLIDAMDKVVRSQNAFIRIRPVEEQDLAASAREIERRKVDVAIIRSDVPPSNGQTLAIIRRDAVIVALPHGSPIDSWADLAKATVAIPKNALSDYNSAVLDLVLNFYNVPPAAVKRAILPMEDIAQAVRQRRVQAVLAIGPIGPGDVTAAVAAVAKGSRGAPTLLTVGDDTDALVQRFPAFMSVDIPTGAFHTKPSVPDESDTTIALTYRFVVADAMLNIVAGALARALFTAKSKLMAITPTAAQIEAPDTSASYPVLPIHPGVNAYLTNGEQSFLDEFQSYLYLGGILLSVLGSGFALVSSRLSVRRTNDEMDHTRQLIVLADRAAVATPDEIPALEKELRALTSWFLSEQADGKIGQQAFSTFSVGLNHARHLLDIRSRVTGAPPLEPATIQPFAPSSDQPKS